MPTQEQNAPSKSGFSWIFDLLSGQPVGQTQNVIARIPGQLSEAQEELTLYAKAQLTLQVVSTAALVGMFLLALTKAKRG
jgi:hypothetical protein